jgi:hypothetical protein
LRFADLGSAAPAEKFSREKPISVIFLCRPASTTPLGLPASVVKKISTDLDFSKRIFPARTADLGSAAPAEKFSREKPISVSVVKKISTDLDFSKRIFPARTADLASAKCADNI